MADITGDQSNNSLTGNEQENDTIRGLEGDDTLLGLSGDDTLDGGEGNDLLDGGLGDDNLNGGNGDDIYQINRDLGGVNTINDAEGNDTLEIFNTEGTAFAVSLEAPAENIIGIERDGANVLVDVGADGIADDLIVEDFFASAGSDNAGSGFIESFGETPGSEIQNFLAIGEAPTVDVTVNLLADDNGQPGAVIANNEINVGESFFVEILVETSSASGIGGFSLDIDFDDTVLEVLSDFENLETIITPEEFDFVQETRLDNDTITLSGGSSDTDVDDDGEPDNVIGANGNPEQFALLQFEATSATGNSSTTLDLEFPGTFANGSSIGGTLGDTTPIEDLPI